MKESSCVKNTYFTLYCTLYSSSSLTSLLYFSYLSAISSLIS